MTTSMIFGATAAAIAVLAIGFLTPRRHCPSCAAVLPRVRLPSSGGQAWRGGWTCPQCGCEIDRKGQRR